FFDGWRFGGRGCRFLLRAGGGNRSRRPLLRLGGGPPRGRTRGLTLAVAGFGGLTGLRLVRGLRGRRLRFGDGFELQAELHRRIEKALDRLEGNDKPFRNSVERKPNLE